MAAKRLPRVCWDSNCWISLIVGTPERIPGLKRVAEAARRGDLEIITSFLAMAETARGRTAPNDPASQTTLDTIRAAFEVEYLIPVLVDRLVAYRAQELLRKYKLRGADGVHLATALLNAADALHTWDGDLLAIDGKEVASHGVTLRIKPADWTAQQALPTA